MSSHLTEYQDLPLYKLRILFEEEMRLATKAAGYGRFTFLNGRGAVYSPRRGIIQPYLEWDIFTRPSVTLYLALDLNISIIPNVDVHLRPVSSPLGPEDELIPELQSFKGVQAFHRLNPFQSLSCSQVYGKDKAIATAVAVLSVAADIQRHKDSLESTESKEAQK